MIRLLIPVPYLARYHAVTYTRSLTKPGNKSLKGRQEETQTQTRKDAKAGKKRLKGRQE